MKLARGLRRPTAPMYTPLNIFDNPYVSEGILCPLCCIMLKLNNRGVGGMSGGRYRIMK